MMSPEDLGIGLLFTRIAEAVIVAEADSGRIQLWNPAAERTFGYPAAEAVGRELQAFVPDIPLGATTEPGELLDLRGIARNGRTLVLEISLGPIESPTHGRLVLVVARDVGDRRRLEEEASRRAHQLKRALDQLVQADRYKDEFLDVMSHELRTPLNFIMGFASLMEDELPGPLNAEQHSYMGKILNGADRMLYLINHLLDFARLRAGRLELDPQPTPYEPLILEVVDTMRPAAADRGIRVEAIVDVPGLPVVDGPRIIQVVANLVSNAIKFTPKDGQVTVRAFVRDGELITEVTDTGPGVAETDQERIFEGFQQADMGRTRSAGGTGIGLTLSRSLVEAHGGKIGVDSVPGQGSTFWFALPLRTG
jgi:PAS domain S-box-containing protein